MLPSLIAVNIQGEACVSPSRGLFHCMQHCRLLRNHIVGGTTVCHITLPSQDMCDHVLYKQGLVMETSLSDTMVCPVTAAAA